MRMQFYGPYDNYKSPEQIETQNRTLAHLHRVWADNTRSLLFSTEYVRLQLAQFTQSRAAAK